MKHRICWRSATFVLFVIGIAGCGGGTGGGSSSASSGGESTPPAPPATGYFAPYTVASSDDAIYSSSSLVLVNANDPSDQRTVGLASTASFQWPLIVNQMNVASDGTTSGEQPYLLALFQSGHWYSLGLDQSLSQSPVQFSSESLSQPICLAGVHLTQRDTPGSAGIVYSVPGPDGECATADDQLRTAQLSDSVSTAPKVLSVSGILGDSRDFFDQTGSRLGSLQVVSNTLVWIDASLSTSTVIGTSTNGTVPLILDSDATQATVLLNGAISHFDGKTAALGGSLYSVPSGDVFGATASDGTTLFFSVNDINLSAGTSSTILESVPLDGSASSTQIYAPGLLSSSPGAAVALAATPNKLFVVLTNLVASGGTYTLAMTNKTAQTNKINPSLTTIDTQQQGGMTITGVSGTAVYYNVPDRTTSTGSGTAKVANEQGTVVSTSADSQWFGTAGNYSRPMSFDFLSANRNPDLFLLASYGSPYAGTVAISSVDASGTSTSLGSLAPTGNTAQYLSIIVGPGMSLGEDDTGESTDSSSDVFFLNASHAMAALLTNTPGTTEAPVNPSTD